MDQRERVLLMVLAGLVLAAGFYYRGTIGSYLSGGSGEPESPTESEPEVNTEQLVSESIERYQEALHRSVGLDSLDFETIDRSGGLAGTVRFQVSLDADTALAVESLSGEFKGQLSTDGLPRGTARLVEPTDHPLSNWTVRARYRELFVSASERIRMRFNGVGFPSGVPFSPGLSGMPERSVLDRTEWRWQDRPVYAVELEADTGSKFLYISRDQPHRLLGVTAGYNPGWSRRINYDSNTISRIRTYREETLVRRFETLDGERTRLMLANGGSKSSSRTRFTLRPDRNNLNVQVATRAAGEESYSSVGEGTVSFENGRPSAFSLELVREATGRQPGIRLQLNSEDLELVERVSSSAVADTSSYETGSVSKLLAGLSPRSQDSSGEVATEPEEGGVDPARQPSATEEAPRTRTKDAPKPSGDDRERRTEVRYPDRSGETVVRSLDTNFKVSQPPPRFRQVQDLYRRGQVESALAGLEDLRDTYPRSINVHFTLGLIHYNKGRPEEARSRFRRVLSLGYDSQLVEWSRAYLKQLDAPASNPNSLFRKRPEG